MKGIVIKIIIYVQINVYKEMIDKSIAYIKSTDTETNSINFVRMSYTSTIEKLKKTHL